MDHFSTRAILHLASFLVDSGVHPYMNLCHLLFILGHNLDRFVYFTSESLFFLSSIAFIFLVDFELLISQ